MSTSRTQDIDSAVDALDVAVEPQQVTGTGDIDGASYDRLADKMPEGAGFLVKLNGTSSGDSFKFKLQESSDDSTWSDVSGKTVTVDHSGKKGVIKADMSGLEQYVRLKSASGDQTVNSASLELAGFLVAIGAQESQTL